MSQPGVEDLLLDYEVEEVFALRGGAVGSARVRGLAGVASGGYTLLDAYHP